MELGARKQGILAALIEHYVRTAEPVSSHMILQNSGMQISSATVRNELAELEELGLVEQPHTSAGRIPTDAGYRFYVNSLMQPKSLARSDTSRIRRELRPLYVEISGILDEACHLLSEVTHYTSVILVPTLDSDAMKHVQLGKVNPHRLLVMLISSSGKMEHKLYEVDTPISVDRLNQITNYLNAMLKGKTMGTVKKMKFEEVHNPTELNDPFLQKAFEILQQTIPDNENERVIVEGIVYILRQPEFADMEKARGVVEVLDEGSAITPMLSDLLEEPEPTVIIGGENRLTAMRMCSFVGRPYHIAGETVGRIGVLGPTRMQYAEAISAVNYLTRRLEECVSFMASL